MTNVIIHGIAGKMGQALDRIISETEDINIAAGIDKVSVEATYPVFTDISECDVPADVIIDFSIAAAVPAIIE